MMSNGIKTHSADGAGRPRFPRCEWIPVIWQDCCGLLSLFSSVCPSWRSGWNSARRCDFQLLHQERTEEEEEEEKEGRRMRHPTEGQVEGQPEPLQDKSKRKTSNLALLFSSLFKCWWWVRKYQNLKWQTWTSKTSKAKFGEQNIIFQQETDKYNMAAHGSIISVYA